MRCSPFRLGLLFSALVLLTATGFANILVTTSSTAPVLSSDEIAIGLTNDANAPTIYGMLPDNISVAFATPRSLDSLYVHTDGHPRIEAEDGSINVLTITPGTPVSDMLADIFGVYDADRDHLTIVIDASDGIHTVILPMVIGQASSNFLTIMAMNGEKINSISLGTDTNPTRFHAIRDIYFSGIVEAPEPSSLMLFGGGLFGVVIKISRKFRG